MKRLLFLINPYAGKGEIKSKALDLIDLFTQNGWQVTVHTTQKRMEIPELLPAWAAEFGLIVCCGGDGTLNETVTGLLRAPIRPPLGYIPAGTVNDFASSLQLSKNMLQAGYTIMEGVPFPCDIGQFNQQNFTYVAAFGAFTEASYQTPQQAKNRLGRVAYIIEGIRLLPAIKAYRLTLTHDHGVTEGDFLFGMVSNSTSVGGFKLSDQVDISMNDGLLEVLLVRYPTSAIELQKTLNAVLQQDFFSDCMVGFHTARLQVTSTEELPWTLDGEFGGSMFEADISNLHHAIQVLVDPEPLL